MIEQPAGLEVTSFLHYHSRKQAERSANRCVFCWAGPGPCSRGRGKDLCLAGRDPYAPPPEKTAETERIGYSAWTPPIHFHLLLITGHFCL
jgi:hypothetical protein